MPISLTTAPELACAIIGAGTAALIATQIGATLLSWHRERKTDSDPNATSTSADAALTIIRPVSGIEQFSEATLRSTFTLDHRNLSILFCAANASDPIIPLIERLIAEYPHRHASLLIGNERINNNPKLNNIIKAWNNTSTPWVAFVDGNVLLPKDAVARLRDQWDDSCGMICTPPIGSHPKGLAAELECSFLNGYQARWQLAAAGLGMGFAQGKVMYFERSMLAKAGGISALANHLAEDAAATKVVRAANLHVRLVREPFEQPLGSRTWISVWQRQVRWAQLRRATFPQYFYPEILTSGVLTVALTMIAAALSEVPVAPAAIATATLWYTPELLLVSRKKWHLSAWSLPFAILRDALIPAIWLTAMIKTDFDWQGHVVRVNKRP